MHANLLSRNLAFPSWYDKSMPRTIKFSHRVANIFGALGYINLILQWVWSSLPLLSLLFVSQTFRDCFLPTKNTPPVEATPIALPGPVEGLFLAAAVIFSIGVIIYAIFLIPRSIGRTGHKITEKTAEAALPIIVGRKKLTKKTKRSLIIRVTWAIKAILVAIPAIMLLVPVPAEFGLTQEQYAAAGIILMLGSICFFLVQYITARITRTPPERIW